MPRQQLLGGSKGGRHSRTPTQLKLGQYNPEKEFTVALNKVKAVHRVLTLSELLGT